MNTIVKCSHCGAGINSDAVYCTECGFRPAEKIRLKNDDELLIEKLIGEKEQQEKLIKEQMAEIERRKKNYSITRVYTKGGTLIGISMLQMLYMFFIAVSLVEYNELPMTFFAAMGGAVFAFPCLPILSKLKYSRASFIWCGFLQLILAVIAILTLIYFCGMLTLIECMNIALYALLCIWTAIVSFLV